MRNVYVSPRPAATVIDGTLYLPLDRRNGNAWHPDLADAQDQRIAADVPRPDQNGKITKDGQAIEIVRPDMGCWEFLLHAPNHVRYVDMPAFLNAQPLVYGVNKWWEANPHYAGVTPYPTHVTHEGPAISAYEDLKALANTENADKTVWTEAIGKRDQFRQDYKEIFNIYHHCYTLHILLHAMQAAGQVRNRLNEENDRLFDDTAAKYAKHPLGIAYFLACTAGIAAIGYISFEQILSTSIERFAGEIEICSVVCVFVLAMLAGIGAGLYCGVVELSLWNHRQELREDINQLDNGITSARGELVAMTQNDKIIQPGQDTGLYAQVAPSYMAMQGTAIRMAVEKNVVSTHAGAFEVMRIHDNEVTDAVITETKQVLESIATVIDTKMQENGCTLPRTAI